MFAFKSTEVHVYSPFIVRNRRYVKFLRFGMLGFKLKIVLGMIGFLESVRLDSWALMSKTLKHWYDQFETEGSHEKIIYVLDFS